MQITKNIQTIFIFFITHSPQQTGKHCFCHNISYSHLFIWFFTNENDHLLILRVVMFALIRLMCKVYVIKSSGHTFDFCQAFVFLWRTSLSFYQPFASHLFLYEFTFFWCYDKTVFVTVYFHKVWYLKSVINISNSLKLCFYFFTSFWVWSKEPEKEGRVIMLLNLVFGPDCSASSVEVNGWCVDKGKARLLGLE